MLIKPGIRISLVRKTADDATGRMEIAFRTLVEVEPLYNKFAKAVGKGRATGYTVDEQIASCVEAGILSREEADKVAEYDRLRYDAIFTDAFEPEYLLNRQHGGHEDVQQQTRVA